MTGTPTPFGIDEEDLDTLPRDLPISGFHLHAVSNNLDAAAHAAFIADAVTWSLAAAARLGIAAALRQRRRRLRHRLHRRRDLRPDAGCAVEHAARRESS